MDIDGETGECADNVNVTPLGAEVGDIAHYSTGNTH